MLEDEREQRDEQDWKPRKKGGWITVLVVGVILAAGGAALWFLYLAPNSAVVQSTDGGTSASPTNVDAAETKTLSLADGDALLRKIAEGSYSKEIVKWVSAPNIIQRIAAAVRLIAVGKSPRPVLDFIEITGKFSVIAKDVPPKGKATKLSRKKRQKRARLTQERMFIAATSIKRYDALTKPLTPDNAEYFGKAYAELQPYFDAAFAQVAGPGERFNDILTAAVKRMVSVSIPKEPIELIPKGALYAFKDPQLESLSDAEKHLLRMGPENMNKVQTSLRRFAETAELSLANEH